MISDAKPHGPRWQPYALLALANLFWAGNWVIGRALREAYAPISLSFWRWAVAFAVLAFVAPSALKGKAALLRRHAGLLLVLGLTGSALYQTCVYIGLRSTTAVNAVLLNSSAPLFMMLCSWVLEREGATPRQVAGMLASWAGILVILSRGEIGNLLHLQFHAGDAWIIFSMPLWGVYSVLIKRLPAELRGTVLLFVLAAISMPVLLPAAIVETAFIAPQPMTASGVAGVLYVGLFASVGAFMCWNRAVVEVGANVAGFSILLLPAFGTVLAMVFLGEELMPFHLLGIITIIAGVALATSPAAAKVRLPKQGS